MNGRPYSTPSCTPRDAAKRDPRRSSGYVNLVYFTGPVKAAEELAAWTEARRQITVTEVRVTTMQIVRWQYSAIGMMPVALASASVL
jgi:hypothetical protein